MKKPELLAPAGNLEKLKWALDFGADAVYIGGKDYSLRANANNFNNNEIKEAIEYAHKYGKKVYVTVNMIFHNEDFQNLKQYLMFLKNINVDGIIVSDLGVINILNKNNINIPIIISTQESVTNYEVLKFYKNLGASKVVLARECSKEDIILAKKNVDIELEVFIHGAMCTSYSGRCVLSNYVTNRDSNRGGCAQICRFIFNIDEYDKEFSMSSKDLNMVDYISELIDLEVESFKIEGRMKSVYYIATVVDAYKNIINKKISGTLTEKDIEYYKTVLNRCANRENIPQFYNKLPGKNEQYYSGREEVSNQDFLGIILEYDEKNKKALIEQRNYFEIGDTIEIFGPNTKVFSFKIKSIENEKGEKYDAARHPQEKIIINMPNKVFKNDILRVNLLDK